MLESFFFHTQNCNITMKNNVVQLKFDDSYKGQFTAVQTKRRFIQTNRNKMMKRSHRTEHLNQFLKIFDFKVQKLSTSLKVWFLNSLIEMRLKCDQNKSA